VLDYGRTTYHPPAALADHVRTRDVHCRFPGCRRRAADAELDHTIPWAAGGETTAANLHALCLHHHLLKGHAGWRITTHPDGRLTWTTPTGHRHTTAPHDYGPEPPPPSPPLSRPAVPPRPEPEPRDPDVGPPPF
jgi:HNH endonuclease